MSATTTLDFSTLDTKAPADAGTEVPIAHPVTGEPLTDAEGQPVTITLLGEDSAAMRAFDRRLSDVQLENARRRNDPFALNLNSESLESQQVSRLAAATVSWHGIQLDGETLACTEPNAKRFYGDPRFPWLVQQLARALKDRSRFFVKPSTNSSR